MVTIEEQEKIEFVLLQNVIDELRELKAELVSKDDYTVGYVDGILDSIQVCSKLQKSLQE